MVDGWCYLLVCCVDFTFVRRLERLSFIAKCISMAMLLMTLVRGIKIMALFALDGVGQESCVVLLQCMGPSLMVAFIIVSYVL